jgi:phosphohistidine phosphatase
MRLMLLRHAKAEKSEAGMRDRDRRLSDRGRRDAAQIAAYMVRQRFVPDRVLVSAAQRTRETWEHMIAAFSTDPVVAFEEGLYEAAPEDITGVIRTGGHSAAGLLVIGHNPGLYEAARVLLAHPEAALQLADGLPTTGLIVIDFAGNNWRALAAASGRLIDFATPRLTAAEDD